MRTRIIERSTGVEIADGKDLNSALVKAFQRQVANSDMLFIKGNTDISLHTFASLWHADFSRLIEVHRKLNTVGIKVDLAPERRNLWRKIKESREVTRSSEAARPLAEIVGTELAADIELLMQHKNGPHVRIPGIDRAEVWRNDVFPSAGQLAKRYRDLRFDILVHEDLGLIVIAPSDIFAGRSHFNVANSIGPLRRPR